jgi:hypothetical protein
MLALKEQLLAYFVSVSYKENSGDTTGEVQLHARGGSERKGQAQLKWWKHAGMLIIKQVELKYDSVAEKCAVPRPKEHAREFLSACALMLENAQAVGLGLRVVRMEAVLSEGLATALRQEGWTVPDPFYCGANADRTTAATPVRAHM